MNRSLYILLFAISTYLSMIIPGLTIPTLIVHLILVYHRLLDIGKNKLYLLLYLIPIINIYITFISLFYPTNYETTQKADNWLYFGYILITLVLLSIIGFGIYIITNQL